MIEVLVYDKNGVEVSNGDTIRRFVIKMDFQDEWGDNIPNGHYRFHCDTECYWAEYVYYPDIDDDFLFLVPMGNEYDRAELERLFGLVGCSDEEFQESVVDYLAQFTQAQNLDGILQEISGFTVVKRSEMESE